MDVSPAKIELLGETAPLAPYFARQGRRIRAAVAYFLTNQAYAMSVMEFDSGRSRVGFGTIWGSVA